MDRDMPQCDQGQPMVMESRMNRKPEDIPLERRCKLMNLAQEAAFWIAAHGIERQEFCLFNSMVALLVDARS